MNRLCATLVALCATVVAHSVYAQDDPRKEYLRLQATEFCATVKQPPAALAEALNQAIQVDPQKWLPIAAWWNAIVEKYQALKCGES